MTALLAAVDWAGAFVLCLVFGGPWLLWLVLLVFGVGDSFRKGGD